MKYWCVQGIRDLDSTIAAGEDFGAKRTGLDPARIVSTQTQARFVKRKQKAHARER